MLEEVEREIERLVAASVRGSAAAASTIA